MRIREIRVFEFVFEFYGGWFVCLKVCLLELFVTFSNSFSLKLRPLSFRISKQSYLSFLGSKKIFSGSLYSTQPPLNQPVEKKRSQLAALNKDEMLHGLELLEASFHSLCPNVYAGL